ASGPDFIEESLRDQRGELRPSVGHGHQSYDDCSLVPRMFPQVDLLVRHGWVITMDEQRRIFPDGAIAIVGNRIVDVGPDVTVSEGRQATRTIDAGGGPIHPGLIEAHLHASYHLYRGAIPDQLAEDEVFETIERRFYDTVTDQEEYLAVVLSSLEMIRNGTTC